MDTETKIDMELDKAVCWQNRHYLKCGGYRDNIKMAVTEFAIADMKMYISLHTTSPDVRTEKLLYLKSINFEKAFMSGRVMDMKGFYSLAEKFKGIDIYKDIIEKFKGLAAILKKRSLIFLKELGYTHIVLHAAGSEELVEKYKRNGMIHFPCCSYIIFDGEYKLFNGRKRVDTFNTEQMDYSRMLEIVEKIEKENVTFITYNMGPESEIVTPQNLFVGEIDIMLKYMSKLKDMSLERANYRDCLKENYLEYRKCEQEKAS